MRVSLWIVVSVLAAAFGGAADPEIPHLRRQGTAVQLVVDGQPFLIRGGELGNSTASNSSYLQPFWTRFAELNLNTVLAPVYWDLVEPEEYPTDDELIAWIKHPERLRPGIAMPTWDGVIQEQEYAPLVAYVRSLAPAAKTP